MAAGSGVTRQVSSATREFKGVALLAEFARTGRCFGSSSGGLQLGRLCGTGCRCR